MPRRVQNALDNIEIPECGCPLSLKPSCLIGAEDRWGCRQRRAEGCCECKVRLLPSCQLKHPGGCAKRREGKRCRCGLEWMPECLSPGCDRRRRGRLCDCPRWPGGPCPHIQKARVILTACAKFLNDYCHGSTPDEGWFTYLVIQKPRLYRPERKLPAPLDLTHRATRVAVLADRRQRKEYLWHPQDVLYADAALSPRNLANRIQSFISLLRS